MLLKDLFKMVEQANNFNELIGERSRSYISMSGLGVYTIEADNFKAFKKALKEDLVDEVIPCILNTELRQDEKNSPHFQLNYSWTDLYNREHNGDFHIDVYRD